MLKTVQFGNQFTVTVGSDTGIQAIPNALRHNLSPNLLKGIKINTSGNRIIFKDEEEDLKGLLKPVRDHFSHSNARIGEIEAE